MKNFVAGSAQRRLVHPSNTPKSPTKCGSYGKRDRATLIASRYTCRVPSTTTMTYKRFLLAAFVGVWIWAAIRPVARDDWWLENYLVFVFFPLILLLAHYFELS